MNSLNPFDWSGGPFLALYAVLLFLAWLLFNRLRTQLLEGEGDCADATIPELGPYELALLKGGPERALEVALAEVHRTAALTFNPQSRQFQRLAPGVDTEQPLPRVMVERLTAGPATWKQLQMAAAPRLGMLVGEAERQGLLAPHGRSRRLPLSVLLSLLGLVGLGLIKIYLGIQRDRSISFLAILTAMAVLLFLHACKPRSRRTQLGEEALRRTQGRPIRPRGSGHLDPHSLSMAVALNGVDVLLGYGMAGLPSSMMMMTTGSGRGRKESGDSAAVCGTSSCTSSGDGGSSGCGGCGGGGD
jgi:uncharacterized protein (TIGR04222 family)